jgi:uncharacterized membrane protein SirB2
MKNKLWLKNILISAPLLGILLLFLFPNPLLMPQSLEMMFIIVFIILFFIYSAVIWNEKGNDEREDLHILNAGRVSFLVGSGILTIGIFVQSLNHNIDPWLIYALISMIFTKIIIRIYSEIKN